MPADNRALTPEVIAYRGQAARFNNLARIAELNGGHLPTERRDPTAATVATTRYQSPGQPMVPEWDATTAIQWAFYANVIVYRCMQVLANTAAACPFRAGRTLPKQPGANAEYDETARLAQLLGPAPGGPAPKLSARRLWAWTVVQRQVTGKHGWEIETVDARGQGEVLALWPLVSAMLRAIPSTKGASWWDRFEYGPEGDRDRSRNLSVDQVLYGWNPSATDFRQPESCLQAARLDVSIAVMMDRYSIGFLRNDARPAAVVVTDAFASDDDFRRWKSQWYGEFGGPDNANKTAFMEMPDDSTLKPSEAMFVQTLGLTQKDARFIEQHKASLERIAMACGVPWSKLDASGRTFDNAGEEDETFWMLTMLPLLSDLADEVNMQLSPRVGREVGWFDLSHVKVFQPVKMVQLVGAPDLLRARIAKKNEARDLVGLPPVADGDQFLTDDELAALSGGGLLSGVASAVETIEERQDDPALVELRMQVAELRARLETPTSMVETRDSGVIDLDSEELDFTFVDDGGVSPGLLGELARRVEAGELTAAQAIGTFANGTEERLPLNVTVPVTISQPHVDVRSPDVYVDVAPVEVNVPPAVVNVAAPDVHVDVPRSRRVVERDEQGRAVAVVEEPC